MNAFKGLYFKEWKMMKGFFIGPYVLAILLIAISNMGNGDSVVNTLIGMMAFGFIILPAAVLFSLNSEVNQLELFLHNPQSIHQLLFVKFLNGLVCALSFLFVLVLAAVSVDVIWGTSIQTGFETFSFLMILTVQMVIVSIFPAIILVFLWTLHQIWRAYIKGLSIIAVIVLLIFGLQLMTVFRSTAIYDVLTNWGAISIPIENFHSGEFISVSFGALHFIGGMDATVFLGSYVFYGLIALLLYVFSAYLLDRKVEV